jgi:hypothetical protein
MPGTVEMKKPEVLKTPEPTEQVTEIEPDWRIVLKPETDSSNVLFDDTSLFDVKNKDVKSILKQKATFPPTQFDKIVKAYAETEKNKEQDTEKKEQVGKDDESSKKSDKIFYLLNNIPELEEKLKKIEFCYLSNLEPMDKIAQPSMLSTNEIRHHNTPMSPIEPFTAPIVTNKIENNAYDFPIEEVDLKVSNALENIDIRDGFVDEKYNDNERMKPTDTIDQIFHLLDTSERPFENQTTGDYSLTRDNEKSPIDHDSDAISELSNKIMSCKTYEHDISSTDYNNLSNKTVVNFSSDSERKKSHVDDIADSKNKNDSDKSFPSDANQNTESNGGLTKNSNENLSDYTEFVSTSIKTRANRQKVDIEQVSFSAEEEDDVESEISEYDMSKKIENTKDLKFLSVTTSPPSDMDNLAMHPKYPHFISSSSIDEVTSECESAIVNQTYYPEGGGIGYESNMFHDSAVSLPSTIEMNVSSQSSSVNSSADSLPTALPNTKMNELSRIKKILNEVEESEEKVEKIKDDNGDMEEKNESKLIKDDTKTKTKVKKTKSSVVHFAKKNNSTDSDDNNDVCAIFV